MGEHLVPGSRPDRRARARAEAREEKRWAPPFLLDPTSVVRERPRRRLKGRCRHDQDRRAFEARKALERTATAFRGIGQATGRLTGAFHDMTRSLEHAGQRTRVLGGAEEALVEAGLMVEGGR